MRMYAFTRGKRGACPVADVADLREAVRVENAIDIRAATEVARRIHSSAAGAAEVVLAVIEGSPTRNAWALESRNG